MRFQTFRLRPGLDVLFVPVDNVRGAIENAWHVPSPDLARLHGKPTSKGGLQFSASTKEGSEDQWSPYRLTAAELPARIVERLERPRCRS